MRFLYICRQFNRSGYYILQHLLQGGKFIPVGILQPKPHIQELVDDPTNRALENERYAKEVVYYGCQPLRFRQSIRELADAYKVPSIELQEIKSDAAYQWFKSLDLDLIVLGGGWKQLIPKRLIVLPRLGIINTHPSLLPDFRGTDVHRWQVYQGVSTSGITIHYIDRTFDTGDILGQSAVAISPNDTPQELADHTGCLAGQLMQEVLERIATAMPERVEGIPQPYRDDSSRYYSRWRWEDRPFLRLDWTRPAEELRRFVLACTQESYKYNGAFFYAHGREYILRTASVQEYRGRGQPGEVLSIDTNGVRVSCQNDGQALLMTQVQPATEGGWLNHFHSEPAIDAAHFALIAGLVVGDRLTST